MTDTGFDDGASAPQRPLPTGGNLLAVSPPAGPGEAFDTLFERGPVRIQRIVSNRHASPAGFWYDQPKDEWVMVVRGEATLAFEEGSVRRMAAGDWVLLPAHCRHRIEATGPDTVWLAVHVGREAGPGQAGEPSA